MTASMDEEQQAWAQYELANPTIQESSVIQTSLYFCPCGGQKVFLRGELPVCGECGCVDNEYISDEPEWTSGMDNDGEVTDGSRVGAPIDLDLYSSKWGAGCVMKSTSHASWYEKKLVRINFHSSMNHRDRALHQAYLEFDRVRDKLGLSELVIRHAKIKYRDVAESKLTRGAVRAGVKANCVFQACKDMNVPRTTKEIADAFQISSHDMGRTSTIVDTDSVKVTQARDLINRIIAKLDIENIKVHRKKMYSMCDAVENCPKLMGKTPSGVASAIIYTILAPHGLVSKQNVCTAADVSVPTLNKIEALLKQEIC